MFSIINQAENSKIALSESALDTVAKIEYSLKSAAKEIAIKTPVLPNTALPKYLSISAYTIKTSEKIIANIRSEKTIY